MELQGGEEGYYKGVCRLHVESGEEADGDEAQKDTHVMQHCPRLIFYCIIAMGV
jgi:hypothetical protein